MPVPMRCSSCQAVLAVADDTSRRPNSCPRCGGQLSLVRPLRDSRYIVVPPEVKTASAKAPTVRKRREAAPQVEETPPVAEISPDDYTQRLLVGLALFFGSMSLPLAAVAILSPLAKPASAIGLIVGLAAWRRTRQEEPAFGQLKPALVTLFCLSLLAFLGSWRAYREWLPESPPPKNPDLRTVVPTGPAGSGPAKPIDTESWVDADRGAIQQNDVRVRLASAAVDYVKFKALPPAEAAPRLKRLLISLRITSVNYTQPLTYETWADPHKLGGKHEPRLTDSQNRVYKRVTYPPGTEIEGVSGNAVLAGGRPVNDLLIFEAPPLDQILYLRLELPAAAIGASGKLRLQIPRYMITTRED